MIFYFLLMCLVLTNLANGQIGMHSSNWIRDWCLNLRVIGKICQKKNGIHRLIGQLSNDNQELIKPLLSEIKSHYLSGHRPTLYILNVKNKQKLEKFKENQFLKFFNFSNFIH